MNDKIKVPKKLVQKNPTRKPAKMQALTLSQMIAEIAVIHNDKGGATYNIFTGIQPSKGYAVALFGSERRIQREKLTFDDIAKYLKDHMYNMVMEGYCIGTWFDESTGFTYIDTVCVLKDIAEAMDLGKYNAQKSIYDLGNARDIRIV